MSSLNELREFALLFGYQGETRREIRARAPGFKVARFAWTY